MQRFLNTFSNRREQLLKERQHDTTLKNLDCKDTVLDYLFYRRELNRKMTQQIEDASVWNKISAIEKNIETLAREEEFLERALTSENPCSMLFVVGEHCLNPKE